VTPAAVRRAGLFAVVLATAGCGLFGADEPPGPCPRTAILGDAASLVRFRDGSGRDLIDVTYTGRIAAVNTECQYKIDKKTKAGNMSVTVNVAMAVERGPANRDRRADFEYFVTLADLQRQPLEKSVFKVTARFPDNITRLVLADDPVELRIPLKEKQTGRDFLVFVGYQLAAAELEFNRRRQREANE
jgi:hypothetical protein